MVEVPGRGEYRIYGIGADGCAWAVPVDDGRDWNGNTLAAVLKDREAGVPVNEGFGCGPRQSRQMGAAIRGNRKRYGLPPVELPVGEAA